MARRSARQLGLRFGRGGTRPDSEVANRNGFLPHVARNPHHEAHPVHVTMRRIATGPSFRVQRVCAAIRAVISGARRKGVRVLHYSVQDNHLHLMVEGVSNADLSNQMRTLFSRIAFAVNAVARRHGKLFRERHHRHELTKPSEVRNALVYILFNDRKHHGAAAPSLDPCSSAWWFHGWAPGDRPPKELLLDPSTAPTMTPRTWLNRMSLLDPRLHPQRWLKLTRDQRWAFRSRPSRPLQPRDQSLGVPRAAAAPNAVVL